MLFDKLTVKDKSLIDSYCQRYAINSNSSAYRDFAPLHDRLAAWETAKSEYLYKLFGEQFIIEKQVEYFESPSMIASKISKACSSGGKMRAFHLEFRKWIDSLSQFNYWSHENSVLYSLCSCDCLCHEKLEDYKYICNYLPITIEFGEGKKIKIEKSSKPMRVIGKLVKMFNLNESNFEEYRLEHSRILNTKKITGTLCLSIHPLDYMTMSMNSENWTSCMNWSEPGGYRGGTVEVMNSEMTIVAYLKSNENTINWYGDQEWNSKKWRILLTVDFDHILAVKAYPFHHEALTRTALEWVRELAGNIGWYYGSVCEVPCSAEFYYNDNDCWYNIDFTDCQAMYCDWGCDTHYGCMTLNPEERYDDDYVPRTVIHYCGPRTCMCCGSTNYDYYDESFVVCENCCSWEDENGYYCEDCGCCIDEDDCYWINGHCYCSDCVDNYATRCQIEGAYFSDSEIRYIYLARKDDAPSYDDISVAVHRDYCIENEPPFFYELPKNWCNVQKPHRTDDGIYYLNRSEVLECGFTDMFGLWGEKAVANYFGDTE